MSLFQTEAWQNAWWNTWGWENNFETVLPWGNGRCGLYQWNYRLKGIIPVRSLEFVGSNYRMVRSVRTEYNTLFSHNSDHDDQVAFLDRMLRETKWSEAVFNDLFEPSEDVRLLRALAKSEGWMVREAKSDAAWSVATEGDFQTYLGALGSNTRLRLYNRRRVLENLGEVSQENLWEGSEDSSAAFFRLLNGFHEVRWGKPVFGPKSLGFHQRFLESVVAEGGEPMLSVLRCDDRIISVLYNVKYQGRIYNIQSGFEEAFHKKLSLGILHLGYAIEAAFDDPNVSVFDMLAGEGKKHNYKKHLATTRQDLISLMVVRSWLLKSLYRVKDRRSA